MTNEMLEKLNEVAEAVEGRVRDYSGRGMYGRYCYGITCDNPTACIEEAGARGIKGAYTDNMGLKYIVYWPSLKYEEKADAEKVG